MSTRSTRGHVRRRRRQQQLPSWFVVLAGLVAIIALAALIRLVVINLLDDGNPANTQNNRTWLSGAWTLNQTPDDTVRLLVDHMHTNRINAVYVETGAWRQDGQYRGHPGATSFREQMQRLAPDIKVLCWIWVSSDQVNNADSQTSMVNYVRDSIENSGYDGVHVQSLGIASGSTTYISLIRALEVVTGSQAILSITAPPDHLPTDPAVPIGQGNPTFSWQVDYRETLMLLVDEMVLLVYPSGLKDQADYEQWVAYQVQTYAQDIERLDINLDLILGFPAYPQESLHNPAVENVETAINGALAGIRAAEDAGKRIRGAALYNYTDATGEEWVSFRTLWADR